MRYFKRHKIYTIILIILSIFIYLNYTRIIEPNSKIDKKDKFYINDIYMSDGRIYKEYLSKEEKKAYDEIIDTINKREKTRKIDTSKYPNMTTQDIGNLLITASDAILIDHPELLQYSNIAYKYTSTKIELIISYAIDNPLMEEINTLRIRRIINNIKLKTKDMSDLEKIKYVYEWIGDNSRYDTLFTTASKNQSIYNVFIKKNAVCVGFAKTSQVIFQNIGIESMTITGESTGPHMWNVIKYKGKYYYYDSTYSASIRKKDNKNYYDGLKQEKLNYYKLSHPEWYPKIEEEKGLIK